MAYRSKIDRDLNDMISDEAGPKFQDLALARAMQKWFDLSGS